MLNSSKSHVTFLKVFWSISDVEDPIVEENSTVQDPVTWDIETDQDRQVKAVNLSCLEGLGLLKVYD